MSTAAIRLSKLQLRSHLLRAAIVVGVVAALLAGLAGFWLVSLSASAGEPSSVRVAFPMIETAPLPTGTGTPPCGNCADYPYPV